MKKLEYKPPQYDLTIQNSNLTVESMSPKFLNILKAAVCSTERMKPYFHALVKLLEDQSIVYFADGGTLLGAVRDGHEILWDDDYDIFMMTEEVKKIYRFLSTRPEVVVNGQRVTFAIIEKPPLKPFCQILVIDLDTKRQVDCGVVDVFYMTDKSGFQKPRADDIYPIRRFKLGDIEVNVMNNYTEYLSRVFGSKWQTEYLVSNHAICPVGYRKENNHKYQRLNREQYIILSENFNRSDDKKEVMNYLKTGKLGIKKEIETTISSTETQNDEKENIMLDIKY